MLGLFWGDIRVILGLYWAYIKVLVQMFNLRQATLGTCPAQLRHLLQKGRSEPGAHAEPREPNTP